MPYRRKDSKRIYITVRGVRKSAGTADWAKAKALESRLNDRAWEEDRMGVKPVRSFKELVVKYLKECRGQASYEWKVGMLKFWDQFFAEEEDITRITRHAVDDRMSALSTSLPSAQNRTLNHKVSVLHHALQKACAEWEWIDRVPKFRAYPTRDPDKFALTAEQAKKLLRALPSDLSLFCTLALATGLRSGKIVSLEWSQIDLAKRILWVSGNAKKRANPLPLNDTAMSAIEALRARPVRHLKQVFPEFTSAPIRARWKTWLRVRKETGLPKVGPHTMRHSHNSWLAQAGVPKEIRERLMGHRGMDTNDIYTHFWDVHLRQAVAVIDTVLAQEDLELCKDHRENQKP